MVGIRTVTTIGYGDIFPVTGTSRIIAVLLMLSGVALLGVVTATMTSWIVEVVSETSTEVTDTHQEIVELKQEITDLKALLTQSHSETKGMARKA